MTEFPFNLGMHASGLKKRFGEIQAITNRPNDMVYITCIPDFEVVPIKHGLSKKLLLAPVPENLIQNRGKVNLLKLLQEFWERISSSVCIAGHENVKASLLMPPELVTRTRKIITDHIKYAALREANSTATQPHVAPKEPEETEEVYRFLARPTQLDWKPREERRPRQNHRPITSSQLAASAYSPMACERPSKKPQRSDRDIASGSGSGSSRLKLLGRSIRPGGRLHRPAFVASTIHRGASPLTPVGSVSSSNLAPEEQEFHNLSNDQKEDAQEEVDMSSEELTSQRTKAPVPTEEEIAKGTIWGNIIFDAHIDHLISVINLETNHRILSQKRVQDVYKRLRNPELKNHVSKLVLRPIAYIFHL